MFDFVILKNETVKFKANYLYHIHKHEHYEVIYLLSGKCFMAIGGKDIALNVGECIVINKNISHNFYVNGANGCKINQLEVLSNVPFISSDFIKLNDAFMISSGINNISLIQTTIADEMSRRKLIELELEKVILLCNCLKSTCYEDSPYIMKAIELIKNSYCYDISCAEIAKRLQISERYLRKIFIADMGTTPKDYIINLKIEKAKALLANTKQSIADVAVKVGFNTIQYFSELFKKRIGITPSEFRECNIIKIKP